MRSVISLAFVGYVSCLMYIVSAIDPLEGSFLIGDTCIEVTETPTCHKTLADSFKPPTSPQGYNKPTTSAFLFTMKSPDIAEPLHFCGGRLPPNSTFDPDIDTEVFIHGWLDGICRSAWMREMKEQLFLRGSYNVILIDWTWGNTPGYVEAGLNSRVVGEQVGFVINNIMRQTKCGPEKFHLIGHSFGAIASGYVGRSVKGLRRITGLDPALAPFKYAPPNRRLTYRDAQIVDIIHSNAAECFYAGIGDPRQLGHADFYPNGGSFQPSCYPYIFTSLLKLDLLSAIASLEPRLCSHIQSLQLYKLSIHSNRCEFVGISNQSYEQFKNKTCRHCRDHYAVMGMDYELYRSRYDKNRRTYYLDTLDTCPYYDDSYLGRRNFPFNISCTT